MSYFKRNFEKNGIEIYFDSKPSVAVRDLLKSNGWRWSGFSKCWYNFYSDQHMQFAESICDEKIIQAIDPDTPRREVKKEKPAPTPSARSGRTLSAIPREQERYPFSVLRAERAPFKKGDHCIISFDDNKKRVGIVNEVDISIKQAQVRYITEINSGEQEYEIGWFSFSDIEIYAPIIIPFSLYKGRVVSFVSEEGLLQKGIISEDNEDGSYDIKYYSVDDTGAIEEIENYYVGLERITGIEYNANILPVKVGDKVEYESDDNGTVIGRVEDVSSEGTIDLEYAYTGRWGLSETKYVANIPLSEIRVMARGRRILNRTTYISKEKQKSIDINERIKERIKDRSDSFSDARGIFQNRILYRHQKAGTILADMYNKFAFFYDTGTGKTVMALDIIAKKQLEDNAHFLIIAPKSIIKTAWIDDATKYYPALHILPLYNGFSIKKKRMLLLSWRSRQSASSWEGDPIFYAHIKLISEAFGLGDLKLGLGDQKYDDDMIVDEELKASAQHYIINPELFIREPEKYIEELGVTGIIMDESAILKNYRGKTAKVIRSVAEKMKYVYLLSGKPAPNNIVEYFSQMKIVDPDTFPMTYDSFVAMFCYGRGRNLHMIPANRDLFAEMVSIRSLIISKKDCLDLPDTIDVVRQIDLPDDIMRDYNELYYECMTIIKGMDKSKHFYSAQSRLAVLMKLRQMASGFFMTGTAGNRESKIIVDIHNAKIKELDSVLDQIPEEQVIIWCQFQHEIELISSELSKRAYTVTAYGKTKNLEKSIDDFKNGRAQYIVAHPKTLKYGVTFVNCKYTVYYSFSYSAEDYDQSHDRNYRLGQTETCTYIYIQAADTIDEVMYDKVMNKLSNAEFFEKLIKDAARHGIDYDSLKEKTDDEIKEVFSSSSGDGSLDSLTTTIANREYESGLETDERSEKLFTTYDYLDKIDDPSPSELQWIEENFKVDNPYMYIDYGPYSDRLYDATRPDYYDFIHAEEPYEPFRVDMPFEDYRLFLQTQPQEDWWVYDMYRAVDRALKRMPYYTADVLRDKYGLKTGKGKFIKAIADSFRKKYGKELGYTWHATRVTNEIQDGLSTIAHDDSLRRFADEIKKIYFINQKDEK